MGTNGGRAQVDKDEGVGGDGGSFNQSHAGPAVTGLARSQASVWGGSSRLPLWGLYLNTKAQPAGRSVPRVQQREARSKKLRAAAGVGRDRGTLRTKRPEWAAGQWQGGRPGQEDMQRPDGEPASGAGPGDGQPGRGPRPKEPVRSSEASGRRKLGIEAAPAGSFLRGAPRPSASRPAVSRLPLLHQPRPPSLSVSLHGLRGAAT